MFLLFSSIVFFYFQNNTIVTTETTFFSRNIPPSFEDYKIVQLSDLHSKTFGKHQRTLVQKVNKVNPDLIVFTGDLVDSEKYNEEASLTLMAELVQIAPVYFVTGNHEWWSGKFDSLEEKLIDIGVQVLRNSAGVLTRGNDIVHIIGIDDPAKGNANYEERHISEKAILDSLEGLEEDVNFKILLSHRPEMLSLYADYEFDLVFTGHAHGGQFRIPFIGGVVAPNQGLFPKYTSGKHELDKTTMIVNRGLGNSIIPLRLLNRPEIVVLSLKTEMSTYPH
ncbi:metallophosphoesterase [Alkalihalobacterium alkalinitrilicum]|uniref:metallophosphoesterase n=1 Tax=Alkalihalobacterium alkalinitrilicum TaxID=427920 RepID=UPI000994BEE8|nr:metallophosphoesterase [Alkalihalobacterium alkalinitrilicum]